MNSLRELRITQQHCNSHCEIYSAELYHEGNRVATINLEEAAVCTATQNTCETRLPSGSSGQSTG